MTRSPGSGCQRCGASVYADQLCERHFDDKYCRFTKKGDAVSNEGFKFQASIKDSDGDMVNIRADEAGEFESALLNFPAAAYAQAKATVRGASALGAVVQPQAALAQGSSFGGGDRGLSAPAPQQQYQQPAQYTPPTPAAAAPPQQSHPNAQLHPEGKQCEVCGQVLEYKKTQAGKPKWQCSQWRWNNGSPNGHTMEWIG